MQDAPSYGVTKLVAACSLHDMIVHCLPGIQHAYSMHLSDGPSTADPQQHMYLQLAFKQQYGNV